MRNLHDLYTRFNVSFDALPESFLSSIDAAFQRYRNYLLNLLHTRLFLKVSSDTWKGI